MTQKTVSTLVLIFGLFLWISFFVAGSTVPSDELMKLVTGSGIPLGQRVLSLIGFVFTWTWSNIFWLCCFASLIGEYGREAMRPKGAVNAQAALIRGFFIFLAIATGQLVIVGTISLPPSLLEGATVQDDPSVVSPGQYFRIATFCSFLSFFVGFSPKIFTALLSRVEHLASGDTASVSNKLVTKDTVGTA